MKTANKKTKIAKRKRKKTKQKTKNKKKGDKTWQN